MEKWYLHDIEGNWGIVPLKNQNGYGFEPRELEVVDELVVNLNTSLRKGEFIDFTFKVKDIQDNEPQELSCIQLYDSKDSAMKQIKQLMSCLMHGNNSELNCVVYPDYINSF